MRFVSSQQHWFKSNGISTKQREFWIAITTTTKFGGTARRKKEGF
jgi:hypothetical protein